jgi:prepilin-type N-terminal cleavage/methylation domain-containing protein
MNIYRRAAKAFTLVELLVVIAIISILMALILTVIAQVQEHARNVAVQTFIGDIDAAIKQFELAYQRYPWDEVDENHVWNEAANGCKQDNSPWDLSKEISAEQIFRELAPSMSSLKSDLYTKILFNRNRTNFMSLPPERINNEGRVVDRWGFPFRFAWDPERRRLIIWSVGKNGETDTVDQANKKINTDRKDDISNL